MKKEEVKTYSIEENHHSGLELELHFMPRFFADNPCCAEPHAHEFYQIIWFRRGHGTHHVDFVDYPVSDNTIFFIAPGQVHSFDGVTDYEGVIIHFNASFMADEETSESVFLKYDVFNAYDSLPYYNLLYSPLVLFIICLTFPTLQNVLKLTLCAAISKNNLVHTMKSWKICYQQAI